MKKTYAQNIRRSQLLTKPVSPFKERDTRCQDAEETQPYIICFAAPGEVTKAVKLIYTSEGCE